MDDIRNQIEGNIYSPSPSLLERFELHGVNDYKNISIEINDDVKIISAENGSGKTTVMTILYSLLSCKISRLLEFNFKSFVLKFRGYDELVVSKRELFPNFGTEGLSDSLIESSALKKVRYYGVTNAEIYELAYLAALGDEEEYRKCIGFRKLYDNTPLDDDDIESICNEIIPFVVQGEKYEEIINFINKAMGGVKVLYLPTFRRIESSMPEFEYSKSSYRSGIRRSNQKDSEWENSLIFFGLKDVERKLKSLESDIKKSTFESYSRISARTLTQLLKGGSSSSEVDVGKIDMETVNVILARLGLSDPQIENRIKELTLKNKISEPEYESLRSFLGQLVEIYQEKMDYEIAFESFVKVVDSYWNTPNTEKRFIYDKSNIVARVMNTYTGKPLPLGYLSSGEKQIVSVFARLYLDMGKEYLILIDEPELSLSLEWQQKFLPDILNAPSCKQLIAITHSPFIFDNALDDYAGYMNISYTKPKDESFYE